MPASIGDAAKRAIVSVNKAITKKRDGKVVTAKGNNVTNIGFHNPGAAAHPGPESGRSRHQGDLSLTNKESAPTRPVAHTHRLYGPFSDLSGTPAGQEGGQRHQPPQQPQVYQGEGEDIDIAPQPETQPIKRKQPIAAYTIYDELPTIEAKFSGVDVKQVTACHNGYQQEVNSEQWQAPIALHHDNALLHNHSSVNPKDEYNQQQLRVYKEALRCRKL